MRICSKDKTSISFGKLSDYGVQQRMELASDEAAREMFNQRNMQEIADHVAEMFGYAHGTVSVYVEEQDVRGIWNDINLNDEIDAGELSLSFTINAQMYTYKRVSEYGKHFMYGAAKVYGYPVVFGIVAHEIGHMAAHDALFAYETRVKGGRPMLVQTREIDPYWDELCADYLAGVVLAKANPPLSQESLKRFLAGTEQDKEHPNGHWRTLAVEMGYQWGRNNPPAGTSAIISDTPALRELLQSFFLTYYNQIYAQANEAVRRNMGALPHVMLNQCEVAIGMM